MTQDMLSERRRTEQAVGVIHALAFFYVQAGRRNRALALMLIAHHIAPRDAAVLRALAAVFIANGAGQQAMGALDQLAALEGKPRAATQLLRARALWLIGSKDEARRAFAAYRELGNRHG